MCGATLVWLFYLPHWAVTPEQDKKLACFGTSPAIRQYASNFLSEAIATFVLVVVASSLVSRRLAPGGVAPGLGPLLVAGLIWSIGLSLGATTGYAINPARDLGPRYRTCAASYNGKGPSDWSYAWIPVLGPIAGGIAAAIFIRLTGI